MVGAFPIYLPAVWAEVELIIIQAGQRLQAVEDGFFADRRERRIAAQAAFEGSNVLEKVVAVEDFTGLFARVQAAQAVSVNNHAAHEQPPVAA